MRKQLEQLQGINTRPIYFTAAYLWDWQYKIID